MKLTSLFGRSAVAVSLASTPASALANIDWPDLPTSGFIEGRTATLDDVKGGNAAFSMNGQSKGTLTISVPQYVFWSDEGGKRHPMILIQAEEAPDGSQIAGLRDFAGNEMVATFPELKLLGVGKPK